jgi:hypothetical protein
MFGWFQRKSKSDLEAKIEAINKQCIHVFTQTWRDLSPKTSTPEELADKIETFSSDAFRFMFTNFPLTKRTAIQSLGFDLHRRARGQDAPDG